MKTGMMVIAVALLGSACGPAIDFSRCTTEFEQMDQKAKGLTLGVSTPSEVATALGTAHTSIKRVVGGLEYGEEYGYSVQFSISEDPHPVYCGDYWIRFKDGVVNDIVTPDATYPAFEAVKRF